MSKKERERLVVFNKLSEEKITMVITAEMLGITVRGARKAYNRFKEKGEESLPHGNRGKSSLRSLDKRIAEPLKKLLENGLHDAGPTFLTEKLEEEYEITVSKETVRRWLIKHGYQKIRKIESTHRKRRERKPSLGMMVQLDGSPHKWFGENGRACTLIVFIDDATSTLLWAELAESESTSALMKSTKGYMEQHGRPCSFYVDHGGVFSVNINNADRTKMTQYQRALKTLDIDLIHAHSPQAKGRVERVNRTLQDRLVKELRLRSITDIEEANRFLQDEYLAMHNKKFAVKAKNDCNAHRPMNGIDLMNVLCIQEKRIVQNDYTFRYKKNEFQLLPNQKTIVRPKNAITISERLDGKMIVSIRATLLNTEILAARPEKQNVPNKFVDLNSTLKCIIP